MKRIPSKAFLALVATSLTFANATAASWSPGPALNHPRGFAASVVDPCGNILVIGGMERVPGGQLVLSSIEMLAFNGTSYASSWVTLPTTLPIERMHHTVVCTGGFLYVIGGSRWGGDPDNVECILTVDRYDFLSSTWDSTTVPPLPYGSNSHASVVDHLGRIWVIGGQVCNVQSLRDTSLVFDPLRPQLGWQTMPPLNTARGFHDAAVDQAGFIWAVGGGDYSQTFTSVEVIDNPCAAGGWDDSPRTLPHPASIYGRVALGADGFLYKSGGWVNNSYTSSVLRIAPRDPSSNWMEFAPLTLARAAHTAVLGRDGHVYVAGGEANGVTSQTSVEVLDTRPLPGDMNQDGVLDFFDIDLFLVALFGLE